MPDAGVGELPRRRDPRQHLDELELGDLHLAEGPAEEHALLRPLPGLLPEALGSRDGADAAHQALVLELHHLLLEAAAHLADGVGQRNPHVLQVDHPRVRAPVADLVQQLVAEAGRVGGHDDLGEAAVARLGVGDGQQTHPVRRGGVGDVDLGAVDHPLVAVAHGAGLDAGHVGPRVGLGDGDGAHHFAPDRGHQEVLAQLVAPELVEGGRRHVGVHADPHGDAGVVAGAELLEEDRGVGVVEAGAAPLRVVAEPEQVELAHPAVEGLVDLPQLVELAGAGRQLRLDELSHRIPEDLVLRGVEEIFGHRTPLLASMLG
jgi:hypothetical protein